MLIYNYEMLVYNYEMLIYNYEIPCKSKLNNEVNLNKQA